MLSPDVQKELQAYALNVISKAKANIGPSKLADSLNYQIYDQPDWGGVLYFTALDYGKFRDQGVQGKDPNALPGPKTNKDGKQLKGAKWYGIQKAPASPYKFGSGLGKPGLRTAIDRWTITKGIPGIRDEKGRFIPRKSLVRLMSRSIYLSGLSPTYFFTDAQEIYNRQITKKIKNSYLTDLRLKLLETFDPLKSNAAYTRFSTSRRPKL